MAEFKKRRGRVTWYLNPASILQTVVSVVATFKLLDIYSRKQNGEGAWVREKTWARDKARKVKSIFSD